LFLLIYLIRDVKLLNKNFIGIHPFGGGAVIEKFYLPKIAKNKPKNELDFFS